MVPVEGRYLALQTGIMTPDGRPAKAAGVIPVASATFRMRLHRERIPREDVADSCLRLLSYVFQYFLGFLSTMRSSGPADQNARRLHS